MLDRRALALSLALAAPLACAARAAEPKETSPQPPPQVEAAAPDRVVQFIVGQPEYAALRVPAADRTWPDALDRLVVFHGARPILDLGLRNERQIVGQGGKEGEALFEEGIVESSAISPDGRSAAILSTQYRRPAGGAAALPEGGEPKPVGTTAVSWVDAAQPDMRFSVKLESGRWVKEVLPLAGGGGLALSTTTGIGAPADFVLYAPGGGEVLRLRESEASANNFTATNSGAFLAVSLAYPDRPRLPQEGVLVLDILRGTHWTYTWSYGGEGEPLSWSLDESGVLEVRLPGATARYDRNGALLRSDGKRRTQAR